MNRFKSTVFYTREETQDDVIIQWKQLYIYILLSPILLLFLIPCIAGEHLLDISPLVIFLPLAWPIFACNRINKEISRARKCKATIESGNLFSSRNPRTVQIIKRIVIENRSRKKRRHHDRRQHSNYRNDYAGHTDISDTNRMLIRAAEVVLRTGQASVSMLQRELKLGYSSAARLVDRMEELGIVGEFIGSKPRKILVSEAEWHQLKRKINTDGMPNIQNAGDSNSWSEHEQEALDEVSQEERNKLEAYKKKRDITCIDGMDGHAFEHLCAELLLKNGFSKAKVTPPSGDQGVDILAEKDGVKYAIQCKNYTSPLSNTPIQEVYAGKQFYNCHVGVVMTNNTFTTGAKELAKSTGVLLWGRTYVRSLIENVVNSESTDTPEAAYLRAESLKAKGDIDAALRYYQFAADNGLKSAQLRIQQLK